jgi:hypothetical protein
MRPWDGHPPWAHPVFYIAWVISGTLGPIVFLAGAIDGTATGFWIGVGLCCLWPISLGTDWLAVRELRRRHAGWTPWEPKSRWLRW